VLKPPRLILEIDTRKLLPGAVRHDEGRTNILDSPWRREAEMPRKIYAKF
jgi:hypothetical protein